MKKFALISVYNKNGIIDFARELTEKYDYEILSTGGTAKLLKENNIPVTEVSEITKFPEILEGRVKTLHPAVHGGLLARRDKPEHMGTILKHNIKPIDLVVIDLYPFKEVISKQEVTLEEAIENIDIGGPSMIRSAAKNYSAVTVISDPGDLNIVLDEIKKHNGNTTLELRQKLASKAFQRTSEYDSLINHFMSAYFKQTPNGSEETFPEILSLNLKLVREDFLLLIPPSAGVLFDELVIETNFLTFIPFLASRNINESVSPKHLSP